MNVKKHGRRLFLKEGAALAGLAVGAIRSASGQILEIEPGLTEFSERSRFEKPSRMVDGRPMTPLADVPGIITPSALHFTNSHRYATPEIDPRQHRLLIHGMVDRPLIFTLEELKRLPAVTRVHFIECAGNTSPSHPWPMPTVQLSHGWTACSEWTGVLLSLLLREAGVQRGARWVVSEGAEPGKLTNSYPLEKAMHDVLVAYGQNGEAVRPEQGYPLRLVVPGWEGLGNTKWLRRIKVVDQPAMARWESGMYASLRPNLDGKSLWFQFEMPAKSVITFPSGGQRLPGRGFYEITGLAWSGRGAIRRVEVSTDGGRSWKDARIEEPVHRIAHTRFRFPWNWNGEEAVVQSRCTDEEGTVQPSLEELARIWGGVSPDYWQKAPHTINHFNPIFPWKVNRDGSVHVTLFT